MTRAKKKVGIYFMTRTFNKNLMYEYAEKLAGSKKSFSSCCLGHTDEEKRANTLYLFRFVFIDMYEKKTMEEAKEMMTQEFLQRHHLASLVERNRYIYLLSLKKDGIRKIINYEFILWLIYTDVDPDKDVIDCYRWLATHCAKSAYTEEYHKLLKLKKEEKGV